MKVLETERLVLRWLEAGDAPFIRELVNEPAWKRHIGDRGVHTLRDAEDFIRRGPGEMYDRLGFSLNLVELKTSAQPIGICGLIKRDSLEDVDLGFALLERFQRHGYAFEAASASLTHGRTELGLTRIVAITSEDNLPSMALLEKLGFAFERLVRLSSEGEELRLYVA